MTLNWQRMRVRFVAKLQNSKHKSSLVLPYPGPLAPIEISDVVWKQGVPTCTRTHSRDVSRHQWTCVRTMKARMKTELRKRPGGLLHRENFWKIRCHYMHFRRESLNTGSQVISGTCESLYLACASYKSRQRFLIANGSLNCRIQKLWKCWFWLENSCIFEMFSSLTCLETVQKPLVPRSR